MTDEFKNRVVMITGAAGNLGRAVALRFAQDNARLILVDHSLPALREAAASLKLPRTRYLLATGDLGKMKDIDKVVSKAVARFDQIDCLVHTVGGFAMGAPVHEQTDLDQFDKMLYLNAQTTYVTLGCVARHMVGKKVAGSLVTVLAKSGLRGAKGMAGYSAGKAAAERIVQAMAEELKDANIRVNGVMPSTLDTAANRQQMPSADPERWVKTSQLADVIAFLCSDAASAITGESVAVYNKA